MVIRRTLEWVKKIFLLCAFVIFAPIAVIVSVVGSEIRDRSEGFNLFILGAIAILSPGVGMAIAETFLSENSNVLDLEKGWVWGFIIFYSTFYWVGLALLVWLVTHQLTPSMM